MKYTGAQMVIEYAIKEGAPYAVVGLNGHSLFAFLDALYDRQQRIKPIMVKHEHVATCLADGYFRATGKPLPVFLHVGPGLLNGLTGIATASLDSSAMVVFTGNVWQKDFGRNASQETSRYFDADQCSVIKPYVKRSWNVRSAEALPEILHKAFKTAVTGRPGPVHIDMSMTVQNEVADVELPDPAKFSVSSRLRGDIGKIKAAVELLRSAEKPVMVCGGGALLSGAAPEVMRLAEILNIPVACAHRGKSIFPEDHPLSIGLCGAEAKLYTNRVISESDVVLAVGMRFTEPDTSSWAPGAPFSIPPSKLIHIDIDPDEIARVYPTEVAIWADAKSALAEINEAMGKPSAKGTERRKEIAKMKEDWEKEFADKKNSDAVPIRPERLMKELRMALPRDASVFVDTGKTKNWGFQQFPAYEPSSYFIGIGFTPMGHAPSAALGVKLARPDKPVVALIGDGSYQQQVWYLSTAVDYDIPVITVIFNDYGFGGIRDTQRSVFNGRFMCSDMKIDKTGELFNPDFVKMAESYGACGERVEKPGDIGPAMARAIKSKRPYVLDMVIDRDVEFPLAKRRKMR